MFMGEAWLPRELYFSLDYEINPIHVVELDFVFGCVSYFFLTTDSTMVKAYAVGLSMRLVKGPLVGLCLFFCPQMSQKLLPKCTWARHVRVLVALCRRFHRGSCICGQLKYALGQRSARLSYGPPR